MLCLSLFTELGEGFSPVHAGVTLIAMVLGMLAGMGASFALIARLGRHLLHLGIAVVAAGTAGLPVSVIGAHTASSWDLAPPLFVIGLGTSIGYEERYSLEQQNNNDDN